LTAAVIAGLAGAAGLAGTAQAVNLNPDGLGQLLIYPYYTTNDGNQTVLSVVNTTDKAKAVKVRFLEGYNSREVLDFNLYMSAEDVWVAAIADGGDLGFESQAGVAHLVVPDTSCTVPDLYGDGIDAGLDFGLQAFLPYAFTGDFEDGGPTEISRASEGYIEMIEMGVLTNNWARAKGTLSDDDPGRLGAAKAATHVLDTETGLSMPADCSILVRNWTDYDADPDDRDDLYDGHWFDDAIDNGDCDDSKNPDPSDCLTDRETTRNIGGLFGAGAVINGDNGTMFSYDAKAVQGYDKSDFGLHYIPGTIHPSLNDGDQTNAFVFFGTPTNEAVELSYARPVGAISAVFMHDNIMNEFTIEEELNASTEWIVTFPTKSWYVDEELTGTGGDTYIPDVDDDGCRGWDPGEPFPPRDGPDWEDRVPPLVDHIGWEQCTYVKLGGSSNAPIPPFTSEFDGEACEPVEFVDIWDREENPSVTNPGERPPVVSPAPPDPDKPDAVTFELCYEVNVIRFGEGSIFGTTSDILLTLTGDLPVNGWTMINFNDVDDDFTDDDVEQHQDFAGLVGLPVVGFAAYEFENNFLDGGSVKANYGGLFDHKASTRRIDPDCDYHDTCGSNGR
jgi:hypothetical protein